MSRRAVILLHDYIAHVVNLVFNRPVTTDGHLAGCRAYAPAPTRHVMSLVRAQPPIRFLRSQRTLDVHDLQYRRPPVSFQPAPQVWY